MSPGTTLASLGSVLRSTTSLFIAAAERSRSGPENASVTVSEAGSRPFLASMAVGPAPSGAVVVALAPSDARPVGSAPSVRDVVAATAAVNAAGLCVVVAVASGAVVVAARFPSCRVVTESVSQYRCW